MQLGYLDDPFHFELDSNPDVDVEGQYEVQGCGWDKGHCELLNEVLGKAQDMVS